MEEITGISSSTNTTRKEMGFSYKFFAIDKAVHTAGMKPNAWQCMTVGLLSKFRQDE